MNYVVSITTAPHFRIPKEVSFRIISNFEKHYLITVLTYQKKIKISFLFRVILWLFIAGIAPLEAKSQSFDTISNWDGITPAWVVWAGDSQVVPNPYKEGINQSGHCFKLVSSTELYDLMFWDMPEAANFEIYPRYNLKIYPPAGGGNVVLKFENSDNTASHEMILSTIPGQWNNLEFNFSGLYSENFTRMVIFPGILDSNPGDAWYIDDITKEIPAAVELQSNLPIVVINTSGVSIPDEPKIPATMGIIDNGPGNTNNITDPFNDYNGFIGIETRGQSTQMFPKKSYAVETRDSLGGNLNVPLLGMPAENDWILYAPYTDKSMLRNVVSFDIGHKMGGYCTRTTYCELVINNDYKGVYVLMEKIKKDKNRVDIATLNPDEISGDDLSGGYILSVDKVPPGFQFGVDGWQSDPVPPYPNAMDITFQYYYPEAIDMANIQKNYIKNFITNAENTLSNTSFSNPETGYNKYFDVPSFVDFMLLNEITKEVDKYRYSTYFNKEKDSDGGKLFAGPAWDFNLGYGNVDYWPMGIDYTGWLYTDVKTHAASIMFWWKRLNEDAYFRDLAKTRWTELRSNKLSDVSFSSVIDSIMLLTEDARIRNFVRWPILGQYVWPNYNWQYNTYADEVEYFENFLFNRLHWMDSHMPGNILKPRAAISAEANTIKLKLYGDYFSRPTLWITDFQLNNAPNGMTVQSVEYLNTSECLLYISSNLNGLPDISVTVSEKAINTFEDLTSNKLESAGADALNSALAVSIFYSGGQVHIRCSQPELLPERMKIVNVTGQTLGIYKLEKTPENTLSCALVPGIYLGILETKSKPVVIRFTSTN